MRWRSRDSHREIHRALITPRSKAMLKSTVRTLFETVLVTLAVPMCGVHAQAQPTSFPAGTIRIVSPFSASTPPDIISRIIATELSAAEGWRVIVENRPGGVTT